MQYQEYRDYMTFIDKHIKKSIFSEYCAKKLLTGSDILNNSYLSQIEMGKSEQKKKKI